MKSERSFENRNQLVGGSEGEEIDNIDNIVLEQAITRKKGAQSRNHWWREKMRTVMQSSLCGKRLQRRHKSFLKTQPTSS